MWPVFSFLLLLTVGLSSPPTFAQKNCECATGKSERQILTERANLRQMTAQFAARVMNAIDGIQRSPDDRGIGGRCLFLGTIYGGMGESFTALIEGGLMEPHEAPAVRAYLEEIREVIPVYCEPEQAALNPGTREKLIELLVQYKNDLFNFVQRIK